MLLVQILIACAPDEEPTAQYGTTPNIDYRSSVAVDDPTWVCNWDAPCPSRAGCAENKPPTLGDPIYVVNGVFSLEFRPGDHLEVRVPFEDVDSNLACGNETMEYTAELWNFRQGGPICHDQPGSTAESGVYLVTDIEEVPDGDFSFRYRLTDVCQDNSEDLIRSFSL